MLRDFWSEWLGWCQNGSGSDEPGEPASAEGGGKPTKNDDGGGEEDSKNIQALLKAYSGRAIQQATFDMAKFEQADTLFCRFLRARKWNLGRATNMFAAALKWRMSTGVEVRCAPRSPYGLTHADAPSCRRPCMHA